MVALQELKEQVLEKKLVLDEHLKQAKDGSGWIICPSSNTDNFNPDTIGNKPKVGFQVCAMHAVVL